MRAPPLRRIGTETIDGVEIHLIDLRLTPSQLAGAVQLLPAEDRRLMAQQARPSTSASFAARWASARIVLGGLLDVPPRNHHIERDSSGRPHLSHYVGFDFNLSYSADRALIAVTSQHARVGVDLERVRDGVAWETVLVSAADQTERLRVCADVRRRGPAGFFDFWVTKEAVLKTIGVGLSFPLRLVRIANPNAATLTASAARRRFTVIRPAIAPGFSAALAVEDTHA
jgi:4'-phosphopantetheinyl transferase